MKKQPKIIFTKEDKRERSMTLKFTFNKYAPHNSYSIEEGLDHLRDYAEDAILIAFDGCHKIYLAMDKASADYVLKDYKIVVKSSSGKNLAKIAQGWYESSCPLKFISAVANVEDFKDIISQAATTEE